MRRSSLCVLAFLSLIVCSACAKRSALDDFAAGGIVDCGFNSWVRTWLDANHNGRWDQGESSVPDVAFVVTDLRTRRAYHIRTDSSGAAQFALWFVECRPYRLEFVALPPAAFELTTPSRAVATHGDTLRFGFVRRGA